MQLDRKPTMVVSSRVRVILDVLALAELLNTLGVPVFGWRPATLLVCYRAEDGTVGP